jgi:ABC-type lipoprotein release transport system permease subunit
LKEKPNRELIFAVDVSSFTKDGFLGSTSLDGSRLEVEFDDRDQGVFLTKEMASRIGVRKGSKVRLVVDLDERPQVAETVVAGVRSRAGISNTKVYYGVGRGGGAILRLQKA